MSQPITVDILSDDDEGHNEAVPPTSRWQVPATLSNPNAVDNKPHHNHNSVATPFSPQPKRQRIEPFSNSTILLIDDDPTPKKPTVPDFTPSPIAAETPMAEYSNDDAAIVKRGGEGLSVPIPTPSVVAETPMLERLSPDVAIVERNSKGLSDPQKFSGIYGVICLESDNESENGSENENWKQSDAFGSTSHVVKDSELSSSLVGSESSLGESVLAHEKLSQMSVDSHSLQISSEDGISQREKLQKATEKVEATRLRFKEGKDHLREREKLQKEAMKAEAELKRVQLKEEKKRLKEREKLQKAAMKAEAAEHKKLEKQKQQWEKGKFALNSIVASVDAKVVELGSVGGHLLTSFVEKGLTYRITSNPIERSIVWSMAVPDQISKLSSYSNDIPYVLVVVEAEEFCNLVLNETLMEHVFCVRSHYPSHTICYVTYRLMAYINKREQEHYKNPDKCSSWRRPPIEEVFAKLTTHFVRVHSRQCLDEAELAEHVVGLTCSLASCRFRKKLTRLSVNANGSLIPKDCIDKDLFRKNSWLKALIAIPKVQPRFALAIRKKYPTMRSLLSVYMDPNKSVHEKEFLLKDLTIEGLLGDDRRLGPLCSKRVYRILTAQSGSSHSDDVEDGADFFSRAWTTPS